MAEMQSMMQQFDADMKSFHESFEADRKTFGQSQHTPEEWQAWGEAWREKGRLKGEEFHSSLKSFVESKGLGDCMQFMPPPPMMGGPGGGPGGPPPDQRYQKGPSGDNRFQKEDDFGRQLREECGKQIFDLVGPPPEQGGRIPTAEEQQQIHEIMKKCEKKAREHFGEVYQDEFSSDGPQKGANQNFGSFEVFFDESSQSVRVTGKFLALVGNTESQVMTDITCGGQSFIDELAVSGFLEDFSFDDTGEGTALGVKASGSQILQLHDNPRCTINIGVAGTINEITMDLADYLDVEETDKGVKFSDGEIDGTVLVHDGEFDLGENNELVFSGKATFLVSNSVGAQASSSSLASDLNVKAALEEGNIGAEVVIVADEEEGAKSDATPYGDLEVEVDIVSEEEVSVTVDSESEEGKTIVMSLDEEVLPVEALEDVEVQVYEEPVAEEGNVSIASTEAEACTREATNLQDVLDPTDDGDCNEFWVVTDKLGTQVLVSNPHYSEKRISIKSASGGSSIPGSPLVWTAGIVGLVGLTLVGAGIVYKRRRPPGHRTETVLVASHPDPAPPPPAPSVPEHPAPASPPVETPVPPTAPDAAPAAEEGSEFVSRIARLREQGSQKSEETTEGKDA